MPRERSDREEPESPGAFHLTAEGVDGKFFPPSFQRIRGSFLHGINIDVGSDLQRKTFLFFAEIPSDPPAVQVA